MIVLTGRGFGLRPTLGRAAHLKIEGGRPTLSEETLAFLIERQRLEEGEIRLVLVADDPLYALWMPLPGDAFLVGVVSEGAAGKPIGATDLAVLTEVEGARHEIQEGHLLLVDPAQGRVFVEPSAEEVLRVESARRPRYLVGAAHAPAYTRGGVTIGVWARVRTAEDAAAAVDNGAEGLWFDAPVDDETLEQAARAVGGGDIAFAGPDAQASALARRARVFQVAPPPLGERREQWQTRARAAAEAGEACEVPTLIARLDDGCAPESAAGFDRALLVDGPLPEDLFALPPLWVVVNTPDEAQRAVVAGAAGVVCPPALVAAVKHALREVD